MHFLAACLASMAMMANAQQAQPVPVATMNGAPQPAVLAPHDPCFYMGGDCAQCLTIPECTFCTPTVKTTGQCVLKSNSAVCASEYYAFPADTCSVAGLGLQWWVWIGIAAGILLLLVLLTWCCCLCRRRSQRKRAEWIAKQDREATAASESRAEKYAARKEESAARARALKDKYNMLNDSTGDIELPSDAKPVTL